MAKKKIIIIKKKKPLYFVRPETIKLLEENTGSMLLDISLSNIFLDLFPHTRKTKAKLTNETSSN